MFVVQRAERQVTNAFPTTVRYISKLTLGNKRHNIKPFYFTIGAFASCELQVKGIALGRSLVFGIWSPFQSSPPSLRFSLRRDLAT